jgi:hypothetical protein
MPDGGLAIVADSEVVACDVAEGMGSREGEQQVTANAPEAHSVRSSTDDVKHRRWAPEPDEQ